VESPAAGLEGFYWAKLGLEKRLGPDALLGQLPDFVRYLQVLLGAQDWTRGLVVQIQRLWLDASLSASQKNARLNVLLGEAIEVMRGRATSLDRARWVRQARVYELFPRAYNLADKRRVGPWYLRMYQRWRDFVVSRGLSKPRRTSGRSGA